MSFQDRHDAVLLAVAFASMNGDGLLSEIIHEATRAQDVQGLGLLPIALSSPQLNRTLSALEADRLIECFLDGWVTTALGRDHLRGLAEDFEREQLA